jgi:hypothetical protein
MPDVQDSRTYSQSQEQLMAAAQRAGARIGLKVDTESPGYLKLKSKVPYILRFSDRGTIEGWFQPGPGGVQATYKASLFGIGPIINGKVKGHLAKFLQALDAELAGGG